MPSHCVVPECARKGLSGFQVNPNLCLHFGNANYEMLLLSRLTDRHFLRRLFSTAEDSGASTADRQKVNHSRFDQSMQSHCRHPDYTVLAVSNCVKHDGTSYAVLKGVEVEF